MRRTTPPLFYFQVGCPLDLAAREKSRIKKLDFLALSNSVMVRERLHRHYTSKRLNKRK